TASSTCWRPPSWSRWRSSCVRSTGGGAPPRGGAPPHPPPPLLNPPPCAARSDGVTHGRGLPPPPARGSPPPGGGFGARVVVERRSTARGTSAGDGAGVDDGVAPVGAGALYRRLQVPVGATMSLGFGAVLALLALRPKLFGPVRAASLFSHGAVVRTYDEMS